MFSGVLEFLFFQLKEQHLLQYVNAMGQAWDESHTASLGFPLMERSLLVQGHKASSNAPYLLNFHCIYLLCVVLG